MVGDDNKILSKGYADYNVRVFKTKEKAEEYYREAIKRILKEKEYFLETFKEHLDEYREKYL